MNSKVRIHKKKIAKIQRERKKKKEEDILGI
jgi:hypothetical protein